MGKVLVFLQQSNGELPKSTLVAITAARKLQGVWKKDALIGLTLGAGAKSAADKAKEFGFEKVLFSENPVFEKYLAIPYAAALHQAFGAEGCDTAVGSSTSVGKDLFPRLAAMIDAGQASDIISVEDDGTLRRPMYAGNVIANVEIDSPIRVVTVRQTAFDPAAAGGSQGSVSELTVGAIPENHGEFVSQQVSGGERPELSDASIVVSGGRALQSSENFEKYIFPLADALGAAVGASRAAVDSGYAPNDWQVGQTGKVVAPQLYIAIGISGAIQHLAGMKDSKTIVAINKDPDAPIYEVADYGLVADLFQVIPDLTAQIQKAKGK